MHCRRHCRRRPPLPSSPSPRFHRRWRRRHGWERRHGGARGRWGPPHTAPPDHRPLVGTATVWAPAAGAAATATTAAPLCGATTTTISSCRSVGGPRPLHHHRRGQLPLPPRSSHPARHKLSARIGVVCMGATTSQPLSIRRHRGVQTSTLPRSCATARRRRKKCRSAGVVTPPRDRRRGNGHRSRHGWCAWKKINKGSCITVTARRETVSATTALGRCPAPLPPAPRPVNSK